MLLFQAEKKEEYDQDWSEKHSVSVSNALLRFLCRLRLPANSSEHPQLALLIQRRAPTRPCAQYWWGPHRSLVSGLPWGWCRRIRLSSIPQKTSYKWHEPSWQRLPRKSLDRRAPRAGHSSHFFSLVLFPIQRSDLDHVTSFARVAALPMEAL